MKFIFILCRLCNAAIFIFLLLYFLLIPCVLVWLDIQDPGLKNGSIPACAYHYHRRLTDRYAEWAAKRVESGRAAELTTGNISGTEWPVFSSVFYLLATEALQDAWKTRIPQGIAEPMSYAGTALSNAMLLVTDTNHATWVKDHWGNDYLERQNLFYRTLLIAGITSYEKLTGNASYHTLLTNQVVSLAKEIDESRYGMLYDYPGECYPVDVLPAIACIKLAEPVTGINYDLFVERAARAFEGEALDPDTGLPGYSVNLVTGRATQESRGVGNSYMLMWAPLLWPETSEEWYRLYESNFWQERYGLAGFREFAKHSTDRSNEWWFEVDAGPVMAGYGTAASAFGIAAARVCGRFDHAYPMSTEALLAAWPLPGRTWLIPRFISDLTDAPFTGDLALLLILTRRPVTDMPDTGKPYIPLFVLIVLSSVALISTAWLIREVLHTVRSLKAIYTRGIPLPRIQLVFWCILTVSGILVSLFMHMCIGILVLLCAQVLPRISKKEA